MLATTGKTALGLPSAYSSVLACCVRELKLYVGTKQNLDVNVKGYDAYLGIPRKQPLFTVYILQYNSKLGLPSMEATHNK